MANVSNKVRESLVLPLLSERKFNLITLNFHYIPNSQDFFMSVEKEAPDSKFYSEFSTVDCDPHSQRLWHSQ